MAYSKYQLYKITSRLYKELRENPEYITMKKLKGTIHGLYNYGTLEIIIDYRKSIISTLIHEYLHKWNPDKCESWVLKHESMIMNTLTTRQIKNIIHAFAMAICSK
jgi:hypothetical protein